MVYYIPKCPLCPRLQRRGRVVRQAALVAQSWHSNRGHETGQYRHLHECTARSLPHIEAGDLPVEINHDYTARLWVECLRLMGRRYWRYRCRYLSSQGLSGPVCCWGTRVLLGEVVAAVLSQRDVWRRRGQPGGRLATEVGGEDGGQGGSGSWHGWGLPPVGLGAATGPRPCPGAQSFTLRTSDPHTCVWTAGD